MKDSYALYILRSIFGLENKDNCLIIPGKTSKIIKKNIEKLPEKERAVIDMRAKGKTREDIAKYYNITVNTVRYYEQKGIRMLRNPTKARELKEFVYDYRTTFRTYGYINFDIRNTTSITIVGDKNEALAVKNKIINDFKRFDKGYLDYYAAHNHSKTMKTLGDMLEIINKRQQLLINDKSKDIIEYNTKHLRPEEKLHHIILVIEDFDGILEHCHVKERLNHVLAKKDFGVHVIYVTDKEKDDIKNKDHSSIFLQIDSKDKIYIEGSFLEKKSFLIASI